MLNRKKIISTLLISSIVVSPIFKDNQIFAQSNQKVTIEISIESTILAKIESKINTQKMMHYVQKLAIGDNARVAGFYGKEDAVKGFSNSKPANNLNSQFTKDFIKV